MAEATEYSDAAAGAVHFAGYVVPAVAPIETRSLIGNCDGQAAVAETHDASDKHVRVAG